MFNEKETYNRIEKSMKEMGYDGISVFKELNNEYWVATPKLPNGRKKLWYGEKPVFVNKKTGLYYDPPLDDEIWDDLAKLQIPISG